VNAGRNDRRAFYISGVSGRGIAGEELKMLYGGEVKWYLLGLAWVRWKQR
tara:strand:- start:185 stop:334 length:150 start_codon:yes stop_codon:yes gene_type:complete